MNRIKPLTIAVLLTAMLAMPALACHDPSDPFAVEVETASAGITIDLDTLSGLVQTAQGVYVDVTDFTGLVYTAHGDSRLWCLVTEDGVRLQVPLLQNEYEPQPLIDTAGVDWSAVLAAELNWLADNDVFGGEVNLMDVDEITALAVMGAAGHNEKIRWYDGNWVPGIQPGMEISGIFGIRDGSDCGGPGIYSQDGTTVVTTSTNGTTNTGTTTSSAASVGIVVAMFSAGIACVALLLKSRDN